jgi:hypothetical protein
MISHFFKEETNAKRDSTKFEVKEQEATSAGIFSQSQKKKDIY